MRRVGVFVWSSSLAAVMAVSAAGAVAEEAQPAPSTPPAAAPDTAASQPAVADDYYTRRAKNVLAAEKTAAEKPHPLAARYPGKDIVVCEAGCPDRKGPEVVYARPHVVPAEGETVESREGSMVPTSETGGAAARQAVSSEPVCVAGCYENLSSMLDTGEPDPAWYPSTPPAPVPPRDKLSPVR
jgi:hypothetical protein